MRVNTNSISMGAQRTLGNVRQDQDRAVNRLSSGDRIYEAAQDPSGLAISEKMTASIRSMQQAERNSLEAISMFQVGEGALSTIQEISVRLKELAMQAANDTLGDGDRLTVEKEYQAMKQEISRISASTEYCGRKLLDGHGEFYEMQVGINNSKHEKINYDMAKILSKTDLFGAGSTSVVTKEKAQDAVGDLVGMVDEISRSRAQIGSISSRMQSSIQNVMISRENLSASRSKIRDADYAQETAANVRAGLLTETSTMALKSINTTPALALRLLS